MNHFPITFNFNDLCQMLAKCQEVSNFRLNRKEKHKSAKYVISKIGCLVFIVKFIFKVDQFIGSEILYNSVWPSILLKIPNS